MHLTDEQLNEYLDHESVDHAVIEAHLASCDECTARLSDLQALFMELDSLPEVTLSTNIAARFLTSRRLSPQLPRWLTLTATLQAAAAVVALVIAIPFISVLLPNVEALSFTRLSFEFQTVWTAWLNSFFAFRLPNFELANLPTVQISTLLIALAGTSVLWIFGNGWLLRNRNS